MSRKIHVRPLRQYVPAENGARTFLPPHGMVREASPYFERLQQIGAAQVRELPARDQRVMIRPVNGAKLMAGVVKWNESHEAALTDNLIQFPEAVTEPEAPAPEQLEAPAQEGEEPGPAGQGNELAPAVRETIHD